MYPRQTCFNKVTSLIVPAALVLASGVQGAKAQSATVSADRLMVVDCLLPGQVRKLGGQMTYLSPRRPTRTTVAECEIRGGEYVAYDRANAQTALGIWMQAAESGDPEAMTYVGIIYEKGMGMPPDYAEAARWYQKAVDKGHAPAMANLAYLYEAGLGVEKDETRALNLYRQSAGIKDNNLVFQSVVDEAMREAQSRIDELTGQLEAQNQQVESLRAELADTQKKLNERRSALASARRETEQLRQQLAEAKAQGNTGPQLAELQRLEAELKAREARVQQQLAEIAEMEKAGTAQQARLAEQLKASAAQDETLREALGKSVAELQTTRAQLAATQARAEEMERQLAQLDAQLKQERSNIAAERERLDRQSRAAAQDSAEELKRLRAQLQAREQALAEQAGAVASLQAEKSALSQQVAKLKAEQQKLEQEQRAASARQASEAESARAQIASLQQRLLQAQQRAAESTATLERERAQLAFEREQLVKRRATANEAQQKEIQRLAQELASREAQLVQQRAEIAALEAESKSYAAELARLRQQAASAPARVASTSTSTPSTERVVLRTAEASLGKPVTKVRKVPAGLELGDFHALIIGNDQYQHLPGLETAVNDAHAVAHVLKERYDFKVKVLENATRDEILNALNDYRLRLREKDSLLIYYAGHGELDRQNLRGYWLPVDAQRDNNTRWISDQMITDQVGLMAARHVLVVADSCYSGVMTRSSGVRLVAKGGDAAEVKRLITLAKLPSRTVLTSGGEKPVLDGGGGGNSIFALAFVEALKKNDGVLEGSALYNAIFDPVKRAAARFKIDQSPRYAVLADTKHRNGEFLFIPAG